MRKIREDIAFIICLALALAAVLWIGGCRSCEPEVKPSHKVEELKKASHIISQKRDTLKQEAVKVEKKVTEKKKRYDQVKTDSSTTKQEVVQSCDSLVNYQDSLIRILKADITLCDTMNVYKDRIIATVEFERDSVIKSNSELLARNKKLEKKLKRTRLIALILAGKETLDVGLKLRE